MSNLIEWLRARRRNRRLRPPGPAPSTPEVYQRTMDIRAHLRGRNDPSVAPDAVANYWCRLKGKETLITGTRLDIDARLTKAIDAYDAWAEQMEEFRRREAAERQAAAIRERDRRHRAALRAWRWRRIGAHIGNGLLLLLKILGILLLVTVALCLMWIPDLAIGVVGMGVAIDRTMRDIERH